MNSIIFRKFSALGLLAAITVGATMPVGVLAQDNSTDTKKEDKKDKSKEKSTKKGEADAERQAESLKANPNRALEVNEDPSMIGKRSINRGLDKWMGGSQEKEVAMGRMYAAEIEKEIKLVDDPIMTEYVNRVGQNIVNHSDAKVPFTIKVVDSDEVNAFALPGGFFYVNRGLILAAENESELAGVMAHEIGHVAARHVVENQGKQQFLGILLNVGAIFGGGILGPVLQNGGGLIAGLVGSKYSRGAEVEADKLGVQYMYAAGYDPNGMATMFEKLAAMNKKKPNALLKLFASHPQSTQRRDYALALAARFPERDEYVLSTSEFQRVKTYLLRFSNAKVTVTGDIDNDGESGRPTLKRRQPSGDDASTDTSTAPIEEKQERPQLKRRTDPTPTPSPSPNN